MSRHPDDIDFVEYEMYFDENDDFEEYDELDDYEEENGLS